MYTMTPFEKKHFDLLNAFHDFENDFFAGTGLSSCKVDVRDEGDKFVMEAELPGFEKDEIHLDVEDDCLKLSAEHPLCRNSNPFQQRNHFQNREMHSANQNVSFQTVSWYT